MPNPYCTKGRKIKNMYQAQLGVLRKLGTVVTRRVPQMPNPKCRSSRPRDNDQAPGQRVARLYQAAKGFEAQVPAGIDPTNHVPPSCCAVPRQGGIPSAEPTNSKPPLHLGEISRNAFSPIRPKPHHEQHTTRGNPGKLEGAFIVQLFPAAINHVTAVVNVYIQQA